MWEFSLTSQPFTGRTSPRLLHESSSLWEDSHSVNWIIEYLSIHREGINSVHREGTGWESCERQVWSGHNTPHTTKNNSLCVRRRGRRSRCEKILRPTRYINCCTGGPGKKVSDRCFSLEGLLLSLSGHSCVLHRPQQPVEENETEELFLRNGTSGVVVFLFKTRAKSIWSAPWTRARWWT